MVTKCNTFVTCNYQHVNLLEKDHTMYSNTPYNSLFAPQNKSLSNISGSITSVLEASPESMAVPWAPCSMLAVAMEWMASVLTLTRSRSAETTTETRTLTQGPLPTRALTPAAG